MSSSRQKAFSPFIDLLMAMTRVAVHADVGWSRAFTDHLRAIADVLLHSPVDDSVIRIHVHALRELLGLMPADYHTRRWILEAQKAILAFSMALQTDRPQVQREIPQQTPVPSSPTIRLPAPRTLALARSDTMGKNKEAIFSFIRRTQRARTKDIIDGFQTISQRTVKRNLKELVRSGLVQKRSEQKAVYYFAIDLN